MTFVEISPAIGPIVTIDAIKQHLRLDGDQEDALLADLTAQATAHTEYVVSRLILKRGFRLFADPGIAGNKIAFPTRPIQSIEVVTGFAADGAPFEIPGDDYRFTKGADPAVLELMPGVLSSSPNGLEIDFIGGTYDAPTDVPDNLRRAMLVLIAHWYEFRGAVSPSQQPASVPQGWETLVAPFRRINL